ncbi:gas vesicle protein GvpM [Haloarchaeobius sp. HRN-SO-5]|uniref:gas vesicle protein GvpM n=1 Tax=Haloarchaeobius sp. HRN-SO-5 TaxID=3446118 RepID=UPI003EC15275
MKPTKREEDALVDLVDVLLREGAVVEADVLVTVADVPLVGLKLRAALAGMSTMTEYGLFEDWDAAQREFARYEDRTTAFATDDRTGRLEGDGRAE